MNKAKFDLATKIEKFLTNFNPEHHDLGVLDKFRSMVGIDLAEKMVRESRLSTERFFEAALTKAKKRVVYKNKQRAQARGAPV